MNALAPPKKAPGKLGSEAGRNNLTKQNTAREYFCKRDFDYLVCNWETKP